MMTQAIDTATFKDSSLLLRADFDPLMDTLKIYFRSGGIYTYVGVPYEVFTELQAAESAGKFFVGNIKKTYDFLKTDEAKGSKKKNQDIKNFMATRRKKRR